LRHFSPPSEIRSDLRVDENRITGRHGRGAAVEKRLRGLDRSIDAHVIVVGPALVAVQGVLERLVIDVAAPVQS
jgi:hypothetical protein